MAKVKLATYKVISAKGVRHPDETPAVEGEELELDANYGLTQAWVYFGQIEEVTKKPAKKRTASKPKEEPQEEEDFTPPSLADD